MDQRSRTRFLHSRTFAAGAICVGALLSRPALAQDYQAAGPHFTAAQEAFAKGQFGRAVEEFKAAYEITHDPVLLFNLAESHRQVGSNEFALKYYRQYLAEAPAAPDRAEVEARIATMTKGAQAPVAPPRLPPPGAAPAPSTAGTAPAPSTAGTAPAPSPPRAAAAPPPRGAASAPSTPSAAPAPSPPRAAAAPPTPSAASAPHASRVRGKPHTGRQIAHRRIRHRSIRQRAH